MSDSDLTIWEGIEAEEAEARLRSLRRRETELEAAFSHQQQMHKFYPDSFAVSLSRLALEQKRKQISSELAAVMRHRLNEPVTVRLEGQEFGNHSANISILGLFLLRLQKLYTSVAQAIQTGPTLRGPIAGLIKNATELRLAHTFPSSFGMELYVPSKLDLMGKSTSSDALEKMFELLASSRTENNLMELSGALGGRAINHLRHLAAYLANSNSSMTVSWLDYTGSKHEWNASQKVARLVVANLQNIIQVSSRRRTITGLLGGASLFRNNFEMEDKENDASLIEGRVITGLAAELTQYFGRMCTVTVDETEVLDRGSGERRTYYVLTAIQGVDGQAGPLLAAPNPVS